MKLPGQSTGWGQKIEMLAFLLPLLLFVIISMICQVPFLFVLVLLLWAVLVLYTLCDLSNRAGFLVFLLTFSLFLLGGEFFELYFGYKQEFEFPEELDRHAYWVLLVGLAFLMGGFLLAERAPWKRRVKRVKGRSAKARRFAIRQDNPKQLEKLQAITKVMLYVTAVAMFIKTTDIVLYTAEHGYVSYYTDYASRVPGVVDTLSEMFTMFVFLHLATMPSKKACTVPLAIYLLLGTYAILTGRRLSFGIALFVVAFYVIFRHFSNRKEGWINGKVILAVVIVGPLLLLLLNAQRYLRYGKEVEGSGILDKIFRFLTQQGSNINMLKLQKQLEGDSLGCTSLYYTLHYLRNNVITRHIFDFPVEYYVGRTAETALKTNCLADYMIYMVNPADFYAGYGYGTSFLAELHHDLGFFGVAAGSGIYGILLYKLYSKRGFSYWKFVIGLMMLEEFVIMPRYGADVILRPFYNLTKMLVLLALFLLVKLTDKESMNIKKGIDKMLRKLKSLISTRSVMLNTPPMGEIRHITDEEVKQLQVVMLQMVKDIHEVCEKHGICYMADGGTALGSVRHKGFIPWDDDVDLIMPRDDLNRFVEIFEEELGDRYEMLTPNSKGHKVASLITEIYAKNTYKSNLQNLDNDLPQGVMIDIFPVEYAPTNPVVRRIKGTIAMILQYIAVSSNFYRLYCSPTKEKFFYQTKEGKFNYNFRKAIGILFSFRSNEAWCNTYDKFVRGKKDTGLWCIPTDVGHYFGHLMPKEVFYPPIEGPFEDMQVKLPRDIHAYLVNAYGDYMWIPPVEQREKHWTIGFCMDVAAEEAKKAQEQ